MVCKCDVPGYDMFIAGVFGQCISETKEKTSFIIGWISIVFFLCMTYPQIRLNLLSKRSEGLSIFLLVCWCCADICNITGLFSLDQLLTQKLLGLYWTTADYSMTIIHIVFMKFKHKKFIERSIKLSPIELGVYISIFVLVVCNVIWTGLYSIVLLSDSKTSSNIKLCKPVVVLDPKSFRNILGQIASYTSGVFNLISRFPQIYKTYKRKMTEGISNFFVIADATGNGLLVVSILTMSQDKEYLIKQAAFYINPLVSVLMDIVILVQIKLYFKNTQKFINENYKGFQNKKHDDEIQLESQGLNEDENQQ